MTLGNVANRLRQGYGGQDVEVLPMVNNQFQWGLVTSTSGKAAAGKKNAKDAREGKRR